MEIAAAGMMVYIIILMINEPAQVRHKMYAALILIVLSIAFWSLYNQTFTSLMFFADRNMQQKMLGMHIDAEFTQFFNPFFIIILSPILSRLWIQLDGFQLNPSIQMKFSLGIFFMSAGYFLLAFGSHFFNVQGVTSPWWLCMSYFLQTIGELLLSPIGLAMITVLCPSNLIGMMMGVWFFSQAASFPIGGMLANIAAMPANLSPALSLPYYTHAFYIFGFFSLLAAIISFSLIPLLNRLTR